VKATKEILKKLLKEELIEIVLELEEELTTLKRMVTTPILSPPSLRGILHNNPLTRPIYGREVPDGGKLDPLTPICKEHKIEDKVDTRQMTAHQSLSKGNRHYSIPPVDESMLTPEPAGADPFE